MTPARPSIATGAGLVALASWASLATLTQVVRAVPPLLLLALSFAIGGGLAVVGWLARGLSPWDRLRLPAGAWALGVVGLSGYHALLFYALGAAPAVEANLLNYLWPLLIVLMTGFLPGERLSGRAIGGAALGLTGIVVLFGPGLALEAAHAKGYAAAGLAGVTWAAYSVLSRRLAHVPSDAIGGFCFVGALLAALGHAALEPPRWPDGLGEWGAVLGLGLGPAGGAFYLWDYAVKHGDLRALGVYAYGTPLASTALLFAFGHGEPSPRIGLAAALVVGGAILATDRRRA